MITATETRTEIIRLRVSPDQKRRFAEYSASIGMCSATVVYRLAMSAMHAHVRPRRERDQEATRRPLVPAHRKRLLPGLRERVGAPVPHLRV